MHFYYYDISFNFDLSCMGVVLCCVVLCCVVLCCVVLCYVKTFCVGLWRKAATTVVLSVGEAYFIHGH